MKRALVLVAVLAGDAAGHGRDPFVLHIEHRPGHEQDVLAGMTIGLVRSHDGGATWQWTCEEAVHYKDPYDPDYTYSAGGSVLAQTLVGAGIDHGGCQFDPTTLGHTIVSSVAAASDGALYIAASDPADAAIYKSMDDGVTFAPIATPGQPGDWWTSIEVARSDPQRIYLSGYRFLADNKKQYFMYVSRNGGTSFTAISTAAFVVGNGSAIAIAGVGANPDVVYAHVKVVTDSGGDAIYRSPDAGATWTQIFTSTDLYGLAFLARASGELVAGTRTSGAWHSTDGGASWQALANPPHISALAESQAGEVWAGTQNFAYSGPMGLPPVAGDGNAIMKSTDLATWTPVLRLQDLHPPACAVGSEAYDKCVAIPLGLGTPWCCLAGVLHITSTEVDCSGANSCGYDMTPDALAGDASPPAPGCHCNAGGAPALWLVAIVWLVLRRRRFTAGTETGTSTRAS